MTQLNRSDLAGMTAEQIVAAHDAGQLSRLLGTPDDERALIERASTGQVGPADSVALARLGRDDLIAKASAEGRFTFTDDTERDTP